MSSPLKPLSDAPILEISAKDTDNNTILTPSLMTEIGLEMKLE